MTTAKYDLCTIADLECVVAKHADCIQPANAVILCHGFGAGGKDLVGLTEEFLRINEELQQSTLFIFPAAPHSLEELGMPGGRAWWMIDMEKLQLASMTGQFRDLRNECPPELEIQRENIRKLILEVIAKYNIEEEEILVGGFSQGSMLMTDYALRYEKCKGLIVWSGTLLCAEHWIPLITGRPNLNVIQSHGQQDMILPFSLAKELNQLFTQAKYSTEFMPFNGQHTIPYQVIEKSAHFVGKVLNLK